MFKKRVLAVFVILQVVVASMFPASAYAATYAPVVDRDWNSTSYCVSGVSNRFDAALGLIGQWGKKIQISNDMYVKLSNESSGGAFWTLADSMVNPVVGANRMATAPEGWGLGPISTVLWFKIVGTCWADYGSPADWMWCTSVNQELIDNANRDFLKVLNGESLGPSGGGGAGSNFVLSLSDSGVNTTYNPANTSKFVGWHLASLDIVANDNKYNNEVNYARNAVDLTLEFQDSNINSILEDSGMKLYAVSNSPSAYVSSNDVMISMLVTDDEPTVSESTRTVNGKQFTYNTYTWTYKSSKRYYYRISGSFGGTYVRPDEVQGTKLIFRGNWSTAIASHVGNSYVVIPETNGYNRYSNFAGESGGGGGGGDNHWPEPTTPAPDPQPTNPEPDPEPPSPPEFDPPGFDPDVPQPDPTPTPVGEPTNTTAADYTPWLRAILTALNVIIDDMGEHCDHIRVAMRDYLNGLYEALSDDLQAYYDDLTDYLSDLAKWIVSHLNFDIKQPDVNVNVPGYDDSSVIGWLRRIYYKLRGTGTPRPDPIDDTDGALDWWTQFLQWITNALGGLLTDFVGDLGGFLQELIDTFPFSIPWDIVAMLTLLDAQRATPDVTFTIPAQNGWWDDITIRINLVAYDDAMATVRGMMLIWWMYILVMKTDWMMLLFDGANNAIGDFVSRLTGKG